MSVRINDNTEEVLEALRRAKTRGLRAIGATAETHAKENETAIDTGLLRNSITFALSGESANIQSYTSASGDEIGTYEGTTPEDNNQSVYIGTNVEYAKYIELGARGKEALHFLKRAVTENADEYKKLLEESMKNA